MTQQAARVPTPALTTAPTTDGLANQPVTAATVPPVPAARAAPSGSTLQSIIEALSPEHTKEFNDRFDAKVTEGVQPMKDRVSQLSAEIRKITAASGLSAEDVAALSAPEALREGWVELYIERGVAADTFDGLSDYKTVRAVGKTVAEFAKPPGAGVTAYGVPGTAEFNAAAARLGFRAPGLTGAETLPGGGGGTPATTEPTIQSTFAVINNPESTPEQRQLAIADYSKLRGAIPR